MSSGTVGLCSFIPTLTEIALTLTPPFLAPIVASPLQCCSIVERRSKTMLDDEIRYQILKAIEDNPTMSQRELASLLGVSLGKANYCLKALIKQGLIKAENFTSNPDKRVYAYLLTPTGVKEKAKVTVRFLQRKMNEYEQIKKEIARLKNEVEKVEIVLE